MQPMHVAVDSISNINIFSTLVKMKFIMCISSCCSDENLGISIPATVKDTLGDWLQYSIFGSEYNKKKTAIIT